MNARTHTLCLVGGSADDTALLGRLLGLRPNLGWQLGEAASADLLLVDIDSIYGHMDWLKAQASGRTVAALTSGDAHSADYQLRKPITIDPLSALLSQIGSALPAQHAAAARTATPVAAPKARETAPVPPPASAPVAAAIPAAPEPAPAPPAPHTLLDLIDGAAQSGLVRLQAAGESPLFLDHNEHLAYAEDSSLKALSNWCKPSLDGVKSEPLTASAFAAATSAFAAVPYARLSWLAHLTLGNGQLEADLDPNGRYKLSRWPQSEREFPRHFRIATAMMKAPSTVEEIAAACGASTADVANFINAYRSSGHIEIESSASQTAAEPRRGGLFGRSR